MHFPRTNDSVAANALVAVSLAILFFQSGLSANAEPTDANHNKPATPKAATRRLVRIEAKPTPIDIDASQAAVLVVDMQNDFGAKEGLLGRAGIDISGIRKIIEPTARVLAAARNVGMPVVYLKMGYRADLSDLGREGSPNRDRHLMFGVGERMVAPDGSESHVLVRDTWNTEILPKLKPHKGDAIVYKTRFSGFYETELDSVLKRLGAKFLVVTGCTTSVCVESTVRDAMFRDYCCVVLEDCTSEPLGRDLPRTNHEASLLLIENELGWVANSAAFISALAPGAHKTPSNSPKSAATAPAPSSVEDVRRTVQKFYHAFNSHDWASATEFTTDDWTHINPTGGCTRGREAVLNELKQVHSTFLKGVVDTPEEIAVRFATPDVAVVTVPSRLKGSFTTPDGVKHDNERQIRTFVVVRCGGRWLVMQDQNTVRSLDG